MGMETRKTSQVSFSSENLRQCSKTDCITTVGPFASVALISWWSCWQEKSTLFILLKELYLWKYHRLDAFLKELTIEHLTFFKKLNDQNLNPKHNTMIHYPRMMVMFGPLSQPWCMRFEENHNPLKRHAHVVGNFLKMSKTLNYKHQVQQMYNIFLWKWVLQMHRSRQML